MKFIVFVVVIVAAIEFIRADDSVEVTTESADSRNATSLKHLAYSYGIMPKFNYSIEKVCPGYGSRANGIVDEMESCLDKIDQDKETMCQMIRNHLEKCFKPATNLFEECLPSQSKKVPAMTVKMFASAANYICKAKGEQLFEFVNPCFFDVKKESMECLSKEAKKMEQHRFREKYPSAQDLCNFFDNVRPCLQSHLDTSCANPVTRQTFLGFYDSVANVCDSVNVNEIEEQKNSKTE